MMKQNRHEFIRVEDTSMLLSGRFLIAFALSLCCLSIALQTRGVYAHAQQVTNNCVNNGHCYGVDDWPGAIDGARTLATVRGMEDSDSDSFSFVDNEMWLADTNCQGSGGDCWIEAGYQTNGPKTGYPNLEDWFWAEQYTPDNTTNLYYECDDPNPLNNAPGGNSDYGHGVYINLYRTATQKDWGVVVQGNVTNWSTNGSGCNYFPFNMSPNMIQIGQEEDANSSANINAPHADFTQNQWEHPGFGSYYYQTVDGIHNFLSPKALDNPPWSGWNNGQHPYQSQTGGSWYTCTLYSTGRNPC
ncbi:MAG TPA: hypothetical protein VKU38_04015 [Ktedonobacteraceae bacterium]|nr:hypothetical protein [Ktedonobacteraceae bacterium]